jgi:hypothetical protein
MTMMVVRGEDLADLRDMITAWTGKALHTVGRYGTGQRGASSIAKGEPGESQ